MRLVKFAMSRSKSGMTIMLNWLFKALVVDTHTARTVRWDNSRELRKAIEKVKKT